MNVGRVQPETEIQEAIEHAVMGKGERAAIADLKRRVAELEQTNRALTDGLRQSSPSVSNIPPLTPSSGSNSDAPDSPAKLQETIKRLEDRITSLEEQLRRDSTKTSP